MRAARLAVVLSVLSTLTVAGFVAAAARPARAALPPGTPSLQEIETATVAIDGQATGPGAGLMPMLDEDGGVLTLASANGAYAGVWYDGAGNTIIGYQGSQRVQQSDVAIQTLSGYAPDAIDAYADALAFARRVVGMVEARGGDPGRIYLTGFSEGGMLASFVAWRTGLAGASFGASGLPGYDAGGETAGNFVSFVESGDPIAQYGTDTLERGSAAALGSPMDHYGLVVPLQSPGDDMRAFVALIDGHTLPELQDGQLQVPPDQYAVFVAQEAALQSTYHNLAAYLPDATAFAASLGDD